MPTAGPRDPGHAGAWPRCGASAAIFRGPEVLLVERRKGPLRGLWSLPGGHIEAGELARAAALREVREETGVIATLGGLVDIHEVLRHHDGRLVAHYLLAVFLGRWVAGEPVPGSDAAAARFVPVDAAVATLSMTEGAPDLILRAWERRQAEP